MIPKMCQTVPCTGSEQNWNKKTILFALCLILCFLGFAYHVIYFQPVYSEMTSQEKNQIIKDINERYMHLERTCKNLQLKSNFTTEYFLYRDKPHDLLYCRVPKCGSSYWLRTFTSLSTINYDAFHVITHKIHTSQMDNIRLNLNDGSNFTKTTRFIVTRSPYYRIYSAYIDKFFLSEFWYIFEQDVARYFHKNATDVCNQSLTFAEFIKTITSKDHEYMLAMEQHWLPIEQICKPCTYKYNYIIKEETVFRDRDFLINKVGIQNKFILNYNKISHVDYSLATIEDTFHTIFIYFNRRQNKSCYKIEDLLQRIFKTFQFRGYITEEASFDLGRFGDLERANITKIIEVFQKIYTEHPVLTRDEWKKQRQYFIRKAYQLVDREIIERIKRFYDLDFKMFNYDQEPDELFGNKK